MSILYFFLFAAFISFAGSLQPGPVNLGVLNAAIQERYKFALFIALGGSTPEFIFSLVAWVASAQILPYTEQIQSFSYVIALLFILAGVFIFRSKQVENEGRKLQSANGFVFGFILASLNPQLILFWTAVLAWVRLQGISEELFNRFTMLAFSAGTFAGAFTLHYILLKLVQKHVEGPFIQVLRKHGNKVIGVVLVSLGLIQLLLKLL
ncbi:MAG: LysE family transporter [Bacteroidia bacterium]|nr:LysE family transporter [Bacteroidia bacterium]MCF8426957.1 LysE family transporter [Bacteroidia bacterium]